MVGDDLASIVSSGKVVWMPAHKSHKAVGVATLSNGQVLTTVDWRANRLVDCLAKAAAKSLAAPKTVSSYLCSADAAAAHAACLLGVVTHKIFPPAPPPMAATLPPRSPGTPWIGLGTAQCGASLELAVALLLLPLLPLVGRPSPRPLSCPGVHLRRKCRPTVFGRLPVTAPSSEGSKRSAPALRPVVLGRLLLTGLAPLRRASGPNRAARPAPSRVAVWVPHRVRRPECRAASPLRSESPLF